MKYISYLLLLSLAVPVIAEETSKVNSVATPTLGEWGLLVFVGFITICALYFMRRRPGLS